MTFYSLSQYSQPWILPPGLNLIMAIIGYGILHVSKRIGKNIILIAFLSLWLFSTPIIAQLLINPLQNQFPMLYVNQIHQKKKSIIIVLGGGHKIYPESENGYILGDDTEFRVRYAAYLYHKTHIPIIASGGTSNDLEPTEAELMLQEIRNYFGISATLKEDKSRNTKDEGNFLVSILQKNNIEVAYLVTNAWHMPRAMHTFHHAFKYTKIQIIAAPMGYTVLESDQGIFNCLPSIAGLNTSAMAMHEYIGMLVYYIGDL